jgi:hypothetical protein
MQYECTFRVNYLTVDGVHGETEVKGTVMASSEQEAIEIAKTAYIAVGHLTCKQLKGRGYGKASNVLDGWTYELIHMESGE